MRRRSVVALFLVVSLIAVAAAVATGGTPDTATCSKSFDRRAWADAVDDATGEPRAPGGGEIRHRLANQLIRCEALLGRSQREVWRLLGRPFVGELGKPEDGDAWLTGLDRLLDSEAMYVGYDRRGRVEYVYLGQT